MPDINSSNVYAGEIALCNNGAYEHKDSRPTIEEMGPDEAIKL
jgi:hypothetical protein